MTVKWDNFLGSIAGGQTTTHLNGIQTYSRVLDETVPGAFLVEQLRKKIFSNNFCDADYCKRVGQEYSLGGKEITQLPGGGYFLTIETSVKSEHVSSFEHALEKMGKPLEDLAQIPMTELLDQCRAYGITYLIRQFFEGVVAPKEGDLIVYYNQSHPSQAGIYRNTTSHWNSPAGGTVESKWDIEPMWGRGMLRNPYVFQHDFFFTPENFGSLARFYRIKTVKPNIELPVKHNSSKGPMQQLNAEGNFECVNFSIRKEIENLRNPETKIPQIIVLNSIRFSGVCYHYALGKVLKTYVAPSGVFQGDAISVKQPFLEKYFFKTAEPQIGDLALYSESGRSTHYGVYVADDLIESKWGEGKVYRHPPFYVDPCYGNTLSYYRIKPEFTPEQVALEIKNQHTSFKKSML